jgi:hypothetical protein
MTATWWTGIPAAELPVDCGGATHRLRWAEGALDALDHADVTGERTLAALGGQSHRCIEIFEAWIRHADDLDVLLLGSRGPGDLLPTIGNDDVAQRGRTSRTSAVGGFARTSARFQSVSMTQNQSSLSHRRLASPARSGRGWVSATSDPADEVAMLLALGAGLPHRLVATVAAGWAERLEHGDDRVPAAMPALRAALYGRALAAVRVWLDDAGLDVDVSMCSPDSPSIAGRDVDGVRLTLPFSWLTDVWAKGFATIAGRFCLAATPDGPDRWTLSAIAPDFGPLRAVVVDAR